MSRRGPAMEIWWQAQSVGRKEKHTWNVLRGSVTGKGYEAALWKGWSGQHGDGVPGFNIKKPTKPTRRGFQTPREPLMRNNYYYFNCTNILGIQSHPISREDSGSELGTGCFPHLVPLMEMRAQTPLFSRHIWFNTEAMSPCCPVVRFDERLVMHIKWISIIRLKGLIQSSYWVRCFIFKAEWAAILACNWSPTDESLLRESRLLKAHLKWMF